MLSIPSEQSQQLFEAQPLRQLALAEQIRPAEADQADDAEEEEEG